MHREIKTTKQLSHTNSYTDMVDGMSKDIHNDRVLVLVVADGGIDAQRNIKTTKKLVCCQVAAALLLLKMVVNVSH